MYRPGVIFLVRERGDYFKEEDGLYLCDPKIWKKKFEKKNNFWGPEVKKRKKIGQGPEKYLLELFLQNGLYTRKWVN